MVDAPAVCSTCGGEGAVHNRVCSTCGGSGRETKRKRLEVKIPPGVDDGSRIRIAGEGAPGRGGEPGDHYLITRLRPHRVFVRKGDDLYCEVPTTFAEAALGAEVEVASLNGKVKLKVPPESSSGRTLRLVGMGMPRLKGKGFGDLYVKLKIVTSKNLSEEEKRLISQLAKLRREDPRAGL